MKILPMFFEHTVDLRLCEFRYTCPQCGAFETIPFATQKGDAIAEKLLSFYDAGGALFAVEFDGKKQQIVSVPRSDIENAILRANGDFGPYGW